MLHCRIKSLKTRDTKGLKQDRHLKFNMYALIITNKMKNKKYHTVGTILKSNRKIVDKSISIPLTHKYMIVQLSWLRTDTSIKSDSAYKQNVTSCIDPK